MNTRPDDAATLADAIAGRFADLGVKRIFGVPGGGSSLDIIEAANRKGIDFVLSRSETAGALMAAVTAELTETPGVVLTGIGPGAASVTNGVAYASLERVPLIVLTDCADSDHTVHQVFDQAALFAPVSKGSVRLSAEYGLDEFDRLVTSIRHDPRGPVHLDLSTTVANTSAPISSSHAPDPPVEPDDVTELGQMMARSRYPIAIAGMQARRPDVAAAFRTLIDRLGCPAMTSYKAKGVVDEGGTAYIGQFTHAALDGIILSRADLIVTVGLDPVELVPVDWPCQEPAPIAVLLQGGGEGFPFRPSVKLTGHLAENVKTVAQAAPPSEWHKDDIADLREAYLLPLGLKGRGHMTDTVIDVLADTAPAGTRLTVDSGAHMFSAMTRWPARRPHDVLKSNGLSTMGFAVPAAIASALAEPDRRVVAVTGDGGLMMCLSELSTAVRLNLPIVTVVLNDGRLSLIDIKQQRRQFVPAGVRYPVADFARTAEGMGCRSWRVTRDTSLNDVFFEAFAHDGPCLVDISIDPSGYAAQLAALRG